MGRHRQSTEQLKLQGTYKAVKHEHYPDSKITDYLQVPEKIIPPETLKTDYCRQYYTYHVNLLLRLGILTISDLPELQILFETLELYRKLFENVSRLDPLDDLETYEKLAGLLLKAGKRFSDLGAKYYISPTARNKMLLDSLNIQKAETENQSMTAKLLGKKNT
jgi:hypothetical protein